MKASLSIEAIGDNNYQMMREYTRNLDQIGKLGEIIGAPRSNYWVAEIADFDPKHIFMRRFLPAKKDYKKSNQAGSRGTYLYYLLEQNKIYEVSQPISWTRYKRYFCVVNNNGEIVEVNKEYVNKWINDHLELPY